MVTLGTRLKEAREKKGMTQMFVADKLGISNGTLSGYERNYRDPDTDTLNKLAELYEESIDELMGRKTKPDRVTEQAGEYMSDVDWKIFNQIKALPESDKQIIHEIMERLKKK